MFLFKIKIKIQFGAAKKIRAGGDENQVINSIWP